jgi:uncharacterized membrane protein YfcA
VEFILIYFLIGTAAGILSGLVGIGGGVLIVPMLAMTFQKLNYNPAVIMHLAAGTSLSSMAITCARSLYAHMQRHVPFWDIYKKLAGGVIVGTIVGVFLAHFLHSQILGILFGIFLFLIAIKLLLERKPNPKHTLPKQWGMSTAGFAIGTQSGILGVSGGIFSIPFLMHCNVEMRAIILVSIAVSFTVAFVGSICVLISGSFATGLPPHTIGYVYYPAWFFVTLGSVLFSPLGVWLSYRLPAETLKKTFASLLLVLAIHMVW